MRRVPVAPGDEESLGEGRVTAEVPFRFAMVPEELLADPDVSGNDIRVYGILLRFAGEDGAAFPRYEIISARTGGALKPRTVRQCVSSLVEAKWVIKTPRFHPKSGAQMSNDYHLVTKKRI